MNLALPDPLPGVVVLGVLLPFTGQLGQFGIPISQGIYLAVDEINQTGGLSGRRIGVVTCDTGTDITQALAAAERLIQQVGVPAIVGPAASSITLEVFNTLGKPAGVLMVTPSGTSPALSDIEDDDLLWRTVPSDAFQGAAVAAHIINENFRRVAVVNRDDTYGQGLRQAIQAALCTADRCGEDAYLPRAYPDDGNAQDQLAVLAQLQDFAPDVIVLIAFLDDGIQFLNAAAIAGFENFILTDGTKDPEVITDVRDETLLDNVVGTAPASPAGANFQAFTLEYRTLWEEEPGVFNAQAYDAFYLLAYAAGAADEQEELTGAVLARNLRRLSSGATINAGRADWNRGLQTLRSGPDATIDFVGASGPLDFDERGEAPSDIEGWFFSVAEERVRSSGVLYTAEGEYRPIMRPEPPAPDAGPSPPDGGD